MSIDRGVDKEDVVHKYNGILLSHWIEWNNAIFSNMDGPGDYYTKWNKSNREKQISWYCLYVESKKVIRTYSNENKWTYFQNRNRLTDIESKLMVTKGERGGQG